VLAVLVDKANILTVGASKSVPVSHQEARDLFGSFAEV
jgi:hypothetical protein